MSRVVGKHVWSQTERHALHLWYAGCNTRLFARHLGVTPGALGADNVRNLTAKALHMGEVR
jgi:hypothetical protein